ncbi:actin-interacting protein-like protein [Novymonas esmeraldas]|uniref:Actin-interacting protein-like protein n=1 Tax=Novymonas esmeraldas TaxID=1808958 RepID=A0AAW0EMM9_9TRYP
MSSGAPSPPPPPSVLGTTRQPLSRGASTTPEELSDAGGEAVGIRRYRAPWSDTLSARRREPRRVNTPPSPVSPQRTSRPLSREVRQQSNPSSGRGSQRHSATAAVRSPSPSTAGRRGVRGGCLRNSTLAIAEAEAVRVAREFSMDMYRDLHRRKFKSSSEELDFLRKDFVASRRTLALLHEDNARLERELIARAAELAALQSTLEEMRREAESQTASRRGRVSSSSGGGNGGERASLTRCGSGGGSAAHAMSSLWAEGGTAVLMRVDSPADDGDGDLPSSRGGAASTVVTAKQTAAPSLPTAASAVAPADDGTTATARRSTTRTSSPQTRLSLYAAAGAAHRKSSAAAAAGDEDVQLLIRDLRANLARRDTALNDAQMELGALQHAQRGKETELRQAHADVAEAKKQRDAVQLQLTEAEKHAAHSAACIRDLEAQVQRLTAEKEDAQRQLMTLELLHEHAGPLRSRASLAAGTRGASSSARAREEEEDHLRDQMKLYRSKWQAAEDQAEHLHERISQLQRQLIGSGGSSAAPSLPATEASGGAPSAVQDAAHVAELAALRQQCQETVQVYVEEAQRLQRRLERTCDNAAFQEDQLRQQRQDDARQHHSEVQALQEQLRTAQGELVKAQEDREHLARQLRRSTEQHTTVEVLRGQVEQLKQRLGEVGAELAQTRGRERALSLQTQRERLARATAEHDAEAVQGTLDREQTEALFLREELKLAREQLGVHEACEMAPTRTSESSTGAPSAVEPPSRRLSARPAGPADDGVSDAAALFSETKGYVSLMRMNAALTKRIEELEALLQARPSAGGSDVVSAPTAPDVAAEPTPPPPQEAHPVATTVDAEVRRTLLAELAHTDTDRRQLISDNKTLANAVELLQRRLRKRRLAQTRHTAAAAASDPLVSPATSAAASLDQHAAAAAAGGGAPTRCRSCGRCPRESRVRQRLRAARANDCGASATQRSSDPTRPPPPVPPERIPEGGVAHEVHLSATACDGHGGGNSSNSSSADLLSRLEWIAKFASVATSTPQPQQQQQPLPHMNAAPPVEVVEHLTCGAATQTERTASPPHQQRSRRVHGSVLPPVHYPALLSHSV